MRLGEGYGVATHENPKFPGVLAYLKMLDRAWDSKFTEEEVAMFIATLYYSGSNERSTMQKRKHSQADCPLQIKQTSVRARLSCNAAQCSWPLSRRRKPLSDGANS